MLGHNKLKPTIQTHGLLNGMMSSNICSDSVCSKTHVSKIDDLSLLLPSPVVSLRP